MIDRRIIVALFIIEMEIRSVLEHLNHTYKPAFEN